MKKSHEGKTWRSFDRKPWREVMIESLPLIPDRTHSEYALKPSRRRFAWHVDSYPPSRSVCTHLERLLDALERSTFYDSNCRADWDDFNDSEIMEKDAGLTLQTSERIYTTAFFINAKLQLTVYSATINCIKVSTFDSCVRQIQHVWRAFLWRRK